MHTVLVCLKTPSLCVSVWSKTYQACVCLCGPILPKRTKLGCVVVQDVKLAKCGPRPSLCVSVWSKTYQACVCVSGVSWSKTYQACVCLCGPRLTKLVCVL